MKKLLTLFTLLLTVCSGAWGETIIKTIDFSQPEWSGISFSQTGSTDPETYNGVTFNSKHDTRHFSIDKGVLTFPDNNPGSGNYMLGFPVTGIVGGSITIKVYNGTSTTQFKYTVKDGGTSFKASDGGSGTQTVTGTPSIVKVSGLSNSVAYIYIGRGSSTYNKITKIEVLTSELTNLAESAFYKLYDTSSSTYSALITAAEFPSYISFASAGSTNINSAKNTTSPVTTPHDFSALVSGTTYKRVKTASNDVFYIEAISRVKSIRLYGNGNGGSRSVTTTVTKVSGSGSTFTVSNMSMINAPATIAEYSTGDLTSKSGYDRDTYYTYTISFPGACDIWGIYVEYAEPSTPSYTITLDDNGDYQGNGSATVKAGDATLTISSQASRIGYIVKGYYAEAGCETKIAEANGTLLANKTGFTDADGKWTATENKTLYADWEAATYTLTNEVNTEGYGTVSPASVTSIAYNTATSSSTNTYTVGETVVTATPAAATAEYTYAFDSWSGLPANVTEDATVTANFTRTPVGYTLSWSSNGGEALTGSYTSGTVAFGSSITAPNTPTYEGHVFIGWAESADGAVVNVPATMPATNKTYFAQWVEGSSATITYNLNVGTNAGTNILNSATINGTNITGAVVDQTASGAEGAGASDRTTKLAIKTGVNGDTYDSPTNYVLFKYTIESGKQFTPTDVTIKVANVGSSSKNNIKYKAVLSDGVNSISATYIVKTQDGTVEPFHMTNNDEVVFTGNVELKLWAWTIANKTNGGSAFRMGTPLTISGYVSDIPSTVSGTITASGWNTFSSSYALDLSNITNGTAYVAASTSGSDVTLTPVEDIVAAGTGLMIMGTAGETFTINTTSADATFKGNNLLEGLPNGGTVAVAGEGFNYVFGWTVPTEPGFYLVNGDKPTLGANKAYLHTTTALAGGKLNIIIDDSTSQEEETDGIRSIENGRLRIENSNYYNLAGQRVGKDYKGIVIVNGKKMLNK